MQEIALVEEEETWMTPIIAYPNNGILPTGRNKRRQLLRKSSRYTIQDGIHYRRGFSNPLLRCVAGREVMEILYSTHQGSCGDHIRGKHQQKRHYDMIILANTQSRRQRLCQKVS